MNSFNKKTQIISIFHLLIIFILFVASHGCHQEDRKALLDFKSSLEDPSNRLYSWQQGKKYQNCCDWHGIRCSSDSFHVISINLRNTEYETYYNQYYKYLDLAFNNFQQSQIPFQFSNLTKLTHLDLSKSNFSGSISTQFTNLSSLRYLDLSCDVYSDDDCSQYLSSTKWLRGLVNLQVLKLSGIDLLSHDNFAEHISFFSEIKDLDLSYCGMSGPVFTIQEFNNLSRLSSLDMSYNPISSPFPVSLANLTSLSILHLSSCHLSGPVPYMPLLKELHVDQNSDLHVDLTRMFKNNWPVLKLLHVSETKVTGLFRKLTSNAPLLESLDASGCSIQGSFPKSICKLSNLRDLILSNNNYTGTIPNCITMLRYLIRFDIRDNAIGGNVSLSSFISKLSLTTLDLSSNKLIVATDQHLNLRPKIKLVVLGLKSCNLKGLFPTFICSLTHLGSLDLSDNNLTGTIPSCFYKLKNLIALDLSHNNLHGPLPLPSQNVFYYGLEHNKFNGEISMEAGKRLSTATTIFLSNNELTGSVPSSICFNKYSSLADLDLSNNKLSGIIPTSIRYCTSLEYLNFGFNNLTRNVPKGLEQAKQLRILQLNDNNLDGDPLNIMSKLHQLQILILGNNNFGGSLSDVVGSLNHLTILSLRSNYFNGSIPKEIFDLDQLRILDLSGNKFTGIIDYDADVQLQMASKGIMIQYGKLYGYNSGIDLSSNEFEGEIPEEIGLLKGLSMLNLSHNRLSGEIPSSVGRMNGLESLDLSYNKLSGLIPQSLASMDSLGYLNLSHNNLSGRIPRGPHIDTLSGDGDGSAYVNNSFLCGYLTNNACEGDQSRDTGNNDYENEDGLDHTREKWYFFGVVALGFIIGFWGLFFGLLLKKEIWWFGYWRFVDNVAAKIVHFFLKD
ncbi:hypothetical protein MKW92_050630 [Papaver armeniacum]|nr:hypothetical protein MKW92_050630 [Papaver armeniacum]